MSSGARKTKGGFAAATVLVAAAIVLAATAGVFAALFALATQCGEVCVDSPAADTAWEFRGGTWQWTAQFLVAVGSFVLTLLAGAAALERSRRAVFLGVAALSAWLTWWLAFESGLRIAI